MSTIPEDATLYDLLNVRPSRRMKPPPAWPRWVLLALTVAMGVGFCLLLRLLR